MIIWLLSLWTSLVVQTVKNPPATQETWVQSLDQEDPLEKGMATHSSILAWRILWTEESGRLQSVGLQSQTQLSNFTFSLATLQGGLSWPLTNPPRGLRTHLSVYDVNLEQGRGAEGRGAPVLGLHL